MGYAKATCPARSTPPGPASSPTTATLKPPDALRATFEAAGVDLAGPIVTTCGSGISASILALALAALGREDVPVYDGSWSEWGASASGAPVATGP